MKDKQYKNEAFLNDFVPSLSKYMTIVTLTEALLQRPTLKLLAPSSNVRFLPNRNVRW